MVYIVPTRDMAVRPGQHVALDGRVYHPYLRDWARMSDRASVFELLAELQQVFAREPPVVSRQQEQQRTIGSATTPEPMASADPPRIPPKQRQDADDAPPTSNADLPPPRPPKPGQQPAEFSGRGASMRDVSRDGPPLPPLPHERSNGYAASPRPAPPSSQQLQHPMRHDGFPYDAPAASSSRSPHAPQTFPPRASYGPPPVSPLTPHERAFVPSHPLPTAPSIQPPPDATRILPPQPYPPLQHPAPYPPAATQAPPPPKQPPPDLLSSPFDLDLPSPSQLPRDAPPIPPNPEKQHLLHALSSVLTHQAQTRLTTHLSLLPALQAQHTALLTARTHLHTELHTCTALADGPIASNESILHAALRACATTIANADATPSPPIDDVLVPPSVLARQLWMRVADVAAGRRAMHALRRALDRARVRPDDFARHMRTLGRENFLNMALARKCARGLGLDVRGR